MKVLVVYGSKSGWTKQAATAVADASRERGDEVRLVDAFDMPSVDGADVVFVGAGIRAGHWNPKAVEWLRAHRDQLRELPLALFTVCLSAADVDGPGRVEAEHYADPVVEQFALEPAHRAVFAGGYDPARVTLPERVLLTVMRRGEPIDHSDPDAVATWTREVLATVA